MTVDGSVEAGRTYVGSVVRNSKRLFVAAFFITLGCGIFLDAEILVGMHGVIFARSRGWNNLWVELDSALAVKVLTSSGKSLLWRIKVC